MCWDSFTIFFLLCHALLPINQYTVYSNIEGVVVLLNNRHKSGDNIITT